MLCSEKALHAGAEVSVFSRRHSGAQRLSEGTEHVAE